MTTLEMRDVEKRYGAGDTEVVALSGIHLTVAAGELVAVMGPSGSGKSTLLNLAGGLDAPTAGTVAVAGHQLGELSPTDLATVRRRNVGYVFQRLNLVPTLTAVENVSLPLELDGSGTVESRRSALAALDAAGFSGSPDRFPDDLAGGEQQRVAIARAIVGERDLLLADEPTGALDTATGERILELLAQRAAAGAAVVLVTHEPRFASYADRVLLLRDGRPVDAPVGSAR
jgi:putative ABC transport system ATP-binding protein